MIGGALTLYAWRAPLLKSPAGFEGTAREAFLLYNNIFLVVAAAMVFVGTLAPLITDALEITPLSVGAPYFDKLFPMLMLPLVALVVIGIHAAWKRGQLGKQSRGASCWGSASRCCSAWPLVLGVYGPGKPLTPIGIVLGIWIILSSLFDPDRSPAAPAHAAARHHRHDHRAHRPRRLRHRHLHRGVVHRRARRGHRAGRDRGAGPLCLPLRQHQGDRRA